MNELVPFVSDIAVAVVAYFITCVLHNLYRYFKTRRGALTGEWRGEILDSSGKTVKTDIYNIKHTDDKLYGSIKRMLPENLNYRKWNFYGKIRGKDFFAIFWSQDLSTESYGCWYLHRTSDTKFDGAYLKFDEQYDHSITTVRLTLSRN